MTVVKKEISTQYPIEVKRAMTQNQHIYARWCKYANLSFDGFNSSDPKSGTFFGDTLEEPEPRLKDPILVGIRHIVFRLAKMTSDIGEGLLAQRAAQIATVCAVAIHHIAYEHKDIALEAVKETNRMLSTPNNLKEIVFTYDEQLASELNPVVDNAFQEIVTYTNFLLSSRALTRSVLLRNDL